MTPEHYSVDRRKFLDDAFANEINRTLISRLKSLNLNDCFLTAGCLFQTVWNGISGNEPAWGIKDYDVFYFDDSDLSWEAEDAVIRRISSLGEDLGVCIEVRNQARVHLWYQRRFGADCPQLTSARDGIDRYLISCTCVGLEVGTGALYAPYGLKDLYAGILRMNPLNPQPNLFLAKSESYCNRWPWLTTAPTQFTASEPF